MAFWPIMMGAAGVLTVIGASRGEWIAPTLALCGYVGMRVIVGTVDPQFIEVVSCILWLCVAAGMMYNGAWVPGFLYALSGLTYPVLLIFGARMVYLGLSPIIAEAFAILALVWIGGGLYGMAHTASDTDRPLHGGRNNPLGVAARSQAGLGRDLSNNQVRASE